MDGETTGQIQAAVLSVLGSLYGMICDGAKGSCALKISSGSIEGLDAAMLALGGAKIGEGNGLLADSVEETARRLGYLTQNVLNKADNVMIEMAWKRDR